ncbi:septum formation protein Maf [candidate division WOR-3 bacterium]|nr:septum formation protein Maf [candidate division WOR-3 bacterium]
MLGHICLASASSRRSFFLEFLNVDFSVVEPDIDETPGEGEDPEDFARKISEEKFLYSVEKCKKSDLVVSADTIVAIDGEVLNKPKTDKQAELYLKKLSAREHLVLTAMTCGLGNNFITEVSKTSVVFKELSQREIKLYIRTGEWKDKAGGYAIQGFGSFMVESVRGPLDNVIGFPLTLFFSMTKKYGFSF